MDSNEVKEAHGGDHDYDVVIIGAGISGIYSLYKMRQLGVRACVLEAGSAEGGTWYWYGKLIYVPQMSEFPMLTAGQEQVSRC